MTDRIIDSLTSWGPTRPDSYASTSLSSLRLLAGLALLFLLQACSQIPSKELDAYREAFTQASAASESILIDLDQAKKAAVRKREREEREKAAENFEPSLPFATNYAKFKEQLAQKPLDEIEQRRKALAVVQSYNEVLTQLAEGKSVDAFGDSVGSLVNSLGQFASAAAGSAVPGLGALVGLATTAAKEFEKARLRTEFEEAIENGEPLVQGILDVFIDTLEVHYQLREAESRESGLNVVKKVSRQIREMRGLVESHAAAPNGFASASANAEKVNSILFDVSGGLTDYPYSFSPKSGTTPAYTTVVKAQVDAAVRELENLAAEYRRNNERMEALGTALVSYEALLVQTKVALTVLAESLEAPPNLRILAADIKALAFSVKRSIEEFKAALNASG